MPEVQAINQLAETLQNSILATMAIVTLSVVFMMVWQIRAANAQDKRQFEVTGQLLGHNQRALDNKEALDRLADGQDSAVVVLQNHQGTLNMLAQLIGQSNKLLSAIQNAQEQDATINQQVVKAVMDIFTEQEGINQRLGQMSENLDITQDSNMRLIVLLERLIESLDDFNQSVKDFNGHMETIKTAVLKEVTSEQPVVKPDAPAESSSDKPEPGA